MIQVITITPDTNASDELISEYHAARSLVERFNGPWSKEAARHLGFIIRLLEEAKSSAV